ncbi:Predicted membrane protein [Phaffia rhodozyma]|uniref:Predicted membrane protein n=1 Tax=Phaffia rhodozyma TaxID=264483 RepID=A0A0F7SFF4_PHARH|nr:Predicted membrane protein [Phaffia rhodozyma]
MLTNTFSLPQSSGWLPNWMLFVSTLALFNTVQNYVSPTLSKRVYAAKPDQVSPLANRLFGTWTLASACIRLYAAYNINNKELYNLAFISYLIAFFHFQSELLIYKTCVVGKGWIPSAVVSTVSLVWMTLQRDFYLGA